MNKEMFLNGCEKIDVSQPINKMPVLIIDGNYLGHRAIHGLRITQPLLTLSTTSEMLQFEHELIRETIGLWTTFEQHIGNMVIVKDGESWRKKLKYKPYYIDETEKYGYKENRTEKKDDIVWDNFHLCLDNFLSKLKPILPVFDSEGLEGDDAMLLLTEYFSSQGIISLIFANDGDLNQLVNNKHTVIFKHSKSKDFPDGRIIISEQIKKLYSTDIMHNMLYDKADIVDFVDKIAQIKIGGMKANRTIANGAIEISEPIKTGLVKVITGDKKDNIFPLFGWKAGKTNRRCTPADLDGVVKVLFGKTDNSAYREIITDKDMLQTILLNLRTKTNQNGIAKNILDHYKHNFKINMLFVDNVPEDLVVKFQYKLSENISLLHGGFKPEYLTQISVGQMPDGADIIKTSIPESDSWEQEKERNTNQDIMDSILGN